LTDVARKLASESVIFNKVLFMSMKLELENIAGVEVASCHQKLVNNEILTYCQFGVKMAEHEPIIRQQLAHDKY